MESHIQIFLNGQWQTAAIFEPDLKTLDQGIAGGCQLQYDIDYAVANLSNKEAELAQGITVGFELYRFKQWPPFIVDLLPGGAGRQAWLKRLQITHNGPQADWHLLTKGAGNPPGNLRILEAFLAETLLNKERLSLTMRRNAEHMWPEQQVYREKHRSIFSSKIV